VTIKVRLHDFTTVSRSTTLGSPTDAAGTIGRLAVALLQDLDTSGGVRLLGVGVSGLADWIQESLFGEVADEEPSDDPDHGRDDGTTPEPPSSAGTRRSSHTWAPGMDVVHAELGRGWVWGSGRGVVTVRFETAGSPPGPVRSYRADDPDLQPWRPEGVAGSTLAP
jgi:DNA polymerase-4